MPITSTSFLNSKPLSSTLYSRAYADVILTDPAGLVKSSVLQCLVDTGSDYTILPLSVATALGITPSGPLVSFRAAGGTPYTLPSHPAVDLVIEGYSLKASVAFSISPAFSPVLGRLELLSCFDVGFDIMNCYWD